MAKVTSKLQVTIPKRIADQYGIVPGDEVEFSPAGESIRLAPARQPARFSLSLEERLRMFDEDTAWQREREKTMAIPADPAAERGWRREDLYTRGKPR
jgi:AbrB family looped-hinge helix DNA binding protein